MLRYSLTPNLNVTSNPWTFPFGYNVTYWPPGYGDIAAHIGPGLMGSIPKETINANLALIGSEDGWDITSYFGPAPIAFPYGNRRNLVFTADSTTFNGNIIATINGIGVTGFPVAPVTVDFSSVNATATTQVYLYVTSIVLSYAVAPPVLNVESGLELDWGCIGQTQPFQPDMVCSSWAASLQVGVPATGSSINYTVLNDNFPRNVQSNTTPGQAIDFYGTYGLYGAAAPAVGTTAFQMVNTLVAPPYPALASKASSILVPIPFPVGNVYLNINATGTDNTGTLTATLLQSSRTNQY